jgi:hypothetical protein
MTTQGRQQAYSAGNKTYGFGRSNPTSGPVDKLGYRERNLMQNAIARRMGGAPSSSAAPAPAPFQIGAGNPNGITQYSSPGQGSSLTPSPTGTMQPAPAPQGGFGGAPNAPGAMADGNPQPFHFDQASTAAGFNAAMGGAAPTPAFGPGGHPGAMTPTMAAPQHPFGYSDPAGPPGMQGGGIPAQMANGQTMGAPGSNPETHDPNNPTAGLPGDAQYSQFLQNQQQGQTQHNAEYTQQQHDAQVGAEKQRRDINDNAPDAYKHLLDTYAARGMAHSGRYATDLGEAHNNVAGQLSGIDGDLAQKLNALLAGNANFADNGQRDSQQAMNEMIARLAGNAGSLGLDQNTQNPQAPDANVALQQLLGGQFGQSSAAAPQSAAKPVATKRAAPSAAQAKLTHATSLKHAAVARANAAAAAKKRK